MGAEQKALGGAEEGDIMDPDVSRSFLKVLKGDEVRGPRMAQPADMPDRTYAHAHHMAASVRHPESDLSDCAATERGHV